jgi:hypothetical protein
LGSAAAFGFDFDFGFGSAFGFGFASAFFFAAHLRRILSDAAFLCAALKVRVFFFGGAGAATAAVAFTGRPGGRPRRAIVLCAGP